MKKTIVLMTIVLALLAAPVFAEVGTSGSVDFAWSFGADDNYAEGGEDESSATITLDGTISDYTSISAEFSADSDDDASLSSLTLTQDVTGVLGMDAPVTFGYTLGFMEYSPVDYSDVGVGSKSAVDATAGTMVSKDGDFVEVTTDATTGAMSYADTGFDYYSGSDMLGFKLMFGLADMVNVDVALYPQSMMNKDARGYYEELSNALEMGINAYGTFGMVDASVYYVSSVYSPLLEDDGDEVDETGKVMGLSLSAAPIDGLSVGFSLEHFLAQDIIGIDGSDVFEVEDAAGSYTLNAAYTMDALEAGLGFSNDYYTNSDDTEDDFMQLSDIAIGAKYAVTEEFNVFAIYEQPLAVSEEDDAMDLEMADVNGYEVGANYTFDGVTYELAYSLGSDGLDGWDDSEFMNEDGDERVGAVTFSISASF